MAAPKGNQFWKQRSKHGRDKLFATPELLWVAACEYFEWCDANPWVQIDYKSADVVKVEIPTARPYTLTGLCLYLDCNTSYFKNFEANNKDSEDFSAIITRIRETIYTQKYEGAATGAYNAMIVARDLGLRDEQKIEHTGQGLNIVAPSGEAKDIIDRINQRNADSNTDNTEDTD